MIYISTANPTDARLRGSWWRDGKVMAHAGSPLGIAITDEELVNFEMTKTEYLSLVQ